MTDFVNSYVFYPDLFASSTDFVQLIETAELEPGSESEKTYGLGVGLVKDDMTELISYGFVNTNSEDGQDDTDHE